MVAAETVITSALVGQARDALGIGGRLGGRARARARSKARATKQAGMGSWSRLSRGSDPEMKTGLLVSRIVKTNDAVGWRGRNGRLVRSLWNP